MTVHAFPYDRTAERRARLSLDEPTTIPLTLTGVGWQYLLSTLARHPYAAVQQLGADIHSQINDVLEDRP